MQKADHYCQTPSLFTSAPRWRGRDRIIVQHGFQLIELLIALAVVSLLAMVAIPSYGRYRDKVDNATAAADLTSISQAIERYYTENNRYPDNLNEVNMGTLLDPWKHAYHYWKINGGGPMVRSGARKDKNLVPINSDYDIYSMGKDGATIAPLTAKVSKDDIIRANNGKYIGLASDY